MDFPAAAYQLEADAKAMSESLINRVAPALANGLMDVTDIHFTSVPFSADHIFSKLAENKT